MGRPVRSQLSLSDVVAASHAIVLASWESPRELVDAASGRRIRRVRVLEILDENPVVRRRIQRAADAEPTRVPGLAVGAVLSIAADRTAHTDRVLRQTSPSGASFPVERYQADPAILDGDPLIHFIWCVDGHIEEAAEHAVEPASRRAEVVAAIEAARARRA